MTVMLPKKSSVQYPTKSITSAAELRVLVERSISRRSRSLKPPDAQECGAMTHLSCMLLRSSIPMPYQISYTPPPNPSLLVCTFPPFYLTSHHPPSKHSDASTRPHSHPKTDPHNSVYSSPHSCPISHPIYPSLCISSSRCL